MKHVTRQLEQVRNTGRLMLWLQPILEFVAVIIALGLVLGVLDYLLILPAFIRLVLGVSALAVAVLWLGRRIAGVMGFWPDLTTLALRAERLFPQLKGELATGVEFSSQPDMYKDSPRMAAMAGRAADEADERARGVALNKLINPKPTMRYLGAAGLAIVIIGGLAVVAQGSMRIAAARWFVPFGSAQWPKTTHLKLPTDQKEVLPADAPVPLRVTVDYGYKANMPIRVNYQFTDSLGQAGPMETALMNDQSGIKEAGVEVPKGTFERLIEPPAAGGTTAVPPGGKIKFYFTSYDDQTDEKSLQLIARPAVRSLTAHLAPPAYAVGLIGDQSVDLTRQSGQVATASALTGSTVTLTIELTKPIPAANATADKVLPGLAALPSVKMDLSRLDSSTPVITAQFPLTKTVDTLVHLVDEHDLDSLSQRSYRIEAIVDKMPTAVITLPVADESVLATATVNVSATGQDDVGLLSELLQILKTGDKADPKTVTQIGGKQATLEIKNFALALTGYGLKPGDELVLTAVVQDVYVGLDGKPHDPVTSAPRRLRIIDEATFLNQVRTELAQIRPLVDRNEMKQSELMKNNPADAQAQQHEISKNVQPQQDVVKNLQQRMEMNNVKDAATQQLLQDVQKELDKASEASQNAEKALDKANQEKPASDAQKSQKADAKNQQANADKAMKNVSDMLNQSGDMQKMMNDLKNLAAAQAKTAADTAKQAASTLGKPSDALTPQEKQKNDDLAKEQKDLKNQAEALVQKMMENAAAAKEDNPQAKAAAQAMAEAAKIAQQQDLAKEMQKASDAVKQNQMSSASQSQSSASQTMAKMMKAMSQAENIQREMLKRQMLKLAEALQHLIAQQEDQLGILKKSEDLLALIDPQSLLKKNTMAVEADAKSSREAAEAADDIAKAVVAQGAAIAGMRDTKSPVAQQGESDAIDNLKSALDKVNKAAAAAAARDNAKELDDKQKAYEALAQRERDLRAQAAKLADKAELGRQDVNQLQTYAGDQAKIRNDAHELGATLTEFAVFSHMHTWIDDQSVTVEERLRAAKDNQDLLADQDHIADMLQRMADSLADAKKKQEEFAKAPSGGGGGGGGGAGKPPPKIPPTAQLKLLRALQEEVYTQTSTLDKKLAGQPVDAATRRPLINLAGQERSLADLAAELLKEAQQSGPMD